MNFPIDRLPDNIRAMVLHYEETLGYPVNFQCASIMSAIAAATGKAFTVETRHSNPPQCWISIVGPPGVNKSGPLKHYLRPIMERDKLEYDRFVEQVKEEDAEKAEKLRFYSRIMTDFTIEALGLNLSHKPRGTLVYADELASWLNNMGQYKSKNNERSHWNTLANGNDDLRISRVTRKTELIPRPLVNVCGTIQPRILRKHFQEEDDDGFLQRFWFVYPERQELKPMGQYPDEWYAREWSEILNTAMDWPVEFGENEVIPAKIPLNQKANEIYHNWELKNIEKVNTAIRQNDEMEQAIRSKAFAKVLKTAAIFHALESAAAKSQVAPEVSEATIQSAIQCYEEFFEPCFKKAIYDIQNPETSIPTKSEQIYALCPEGQVVTKPKVMELCDEAGVDASARSIERALSDKKLFAKVGRGKYQKQ